VSELLGSPSLGPVGCMSDIENTFLNNYCTIEFSGTLAAKEMSQTLEIERPFPPISTSKVRQK
jgi:hypothetical protein